ncbi:MAG: hypothetical protein ACFCBW_22090 [Candidatus Competibacterales bacterium]
MSRCYPAILPLLAALLLAPVAFAQSLVDQWRAGLAGSQLTAYQGSPVRDHSTLTVIKFCRGGRYHYYREGSWMAPGRPGEPSVGGGASQGRISGTWDVAQQGWTVFLVYQTDDGRQGSFPMYLQHNGRVNIGGLAYAVVQGGAGC